MIDEDEDEDEDETRWCSLFLRVSHVPCKTPRYAGFLFEFATSHAALLRVDCLCSLLPVL
jgi:hypothetical protein